MGGGSSSPSPWTSSKTRLQKLEQAIQDHDTQLINVILDSFTPARFPKLPTPHAINTYSLLEGQHFQLVLFHFNKGAKIPLHDHPNMTVFTKIVFGNLHVTSFDYANRPPRPKLLDAQEQAVKRGDSIPDPITHQIVPRMDAKISSSNPLLILTPTEGNLHAFEAISETLVLDLLTPPYEPDEARNCHYFELDSLNVARPPHVTAARGVSVMDEPDWHDIRAGPAELIDVITDYMNRE